MQEAASRDLADRSLAASFIYPVLFVIVVTFTAFFPDHPQVSVAVLVVLLLAAVTRALLIHQFERLFVRNPTIWRRGFAACTLVFAITWGLFTLFALIVYEARGDALFVLLSNAGLVAAAVTTLSIERSLVLGYLFAMIVPTMVAAAFSGATAGVALSLMLLLYLLFLTKVALRLNLEYWSALRNTVLLREHAEELESANRELEAFAYSVSHDLRTPLLSMNGFTEILMREAADRLDDGQREYLRRVRDAGRHMEQLIGDLLVLSRVSRSTFRADTLDISEMATRIVQRLEQEEPGRNVDVTVAPGMVTRGDPALLNVALENIIGNAWKYTGTREAPRIEIGGERAGNEIVYFVRDNGVGFDMRYVDKLFMPFQRLHADTQFSGTGIGLATAARAIGRHGGRVWAESRKDGGATFLFTLAQDR